MDVVVWLRSLGLGKYEAAFRENEIDETVLPSLTHETLKELGVTAVGHRLKLLDSIATLRGDASRRPPSDAATKSSGPSVPPGDRAERRQVTVMFSDLVGSTALSARMDPEDLREVISAYQNCVAETVNRFNGFTAQYMGDGVLAYFGYPEAHEDDAERAVQAGLALVAAVRDLKTHTSLQTRVGIATGLVVAGDLIGTGVAQEQAVVGETPNLAARLQGVAEPNAVVIAESTRKLLGNLFEFQDLGARNLRGIGGSVRAFAALRPRSVESRFEALHASGVTDLVGRDAELELLLRRWSKAKAGDGQVVLLSGEAGIGKSRLTAALLECLASEPHRRVRNFCSPQHTDSALYPIIGQFERAAGFAYNDTLQTRLDKLDALLGQSFTSRQDAALLAEMLSLSNDGRYPTLQLDSQQRRHKTLDALTLQVEALSRSSPVLIIFEDVHWIDPTSLETLGRTVARIKTLRVLLIVTCRPEFEPPWIGRPHVTALTLNRFGEHEIASMIDRVAGNKLLPGSIKQDIIERSDGIPLFVEEITKAVLEAESEGAAERAVGAIPSPSVAVPASLHASLMARLDRLGPAKEIAQIGAVIGREFSHSLLVAVVSEPDVALNSALDRVIAAGLLFRQGVPPQATYLFKHAMVQDAAYGTLLREPRRVLHARIAEALERQFPEVAESQPEVLARHRTEAGMIEKASGLWGKAGQRSLERSALMEAAEQLRRALDQIAKLPSTTALRREEIKLQVALITPLLHIKGYAAPETQAAAERARILIENAEALGEPPEDPLLLFSVLYTVWTSNYVASNGDAVRDLSAQFLALAEKHGAAEPLLIAHRIMGISLATTGDIARGRAHFDRALALYDPVEHRALATRFSVDTAMSVLSYRSWTIWTLGYPDAALADAENAIKIARDIGQAGTLMYALVLTSYTLIHCGNYAAASMQTNELAELADEKGSPFWLAFSSMNRGCLSVVTGNPLDGVQLLSSAIDAHRSTGARHFLPWYLCILSSAYLELGRFDDAKRCIGEAMTVVETTKERWCEAEVNRVAGEIALTSPEQDVAKAERSFERAAAVASAQQTRSFELRAAMSLARLWRNQGKPQQASELLAPVYGWFTEGFDTRDLREAKALLQGLGLNSC